MIRTYTELIMIPTFEERLRYLQLHGRVGFDTFGFDRYLNQQFYKSSDWLRVRNEVIIRDNALDLAMPGYDIKSSILIHHMNPITKSDILQHSMTILDPEYLICVSHDTHNAIHYGGEEKLLRFQVDRKPNDMCPWKESE